MAQGIGDYHTKLESPAAPGFGALLRQWRVLRCLSHRGLARLANCDQSYISQLESGSRNPGHAMVTALVDALELTGAHRAMLYGSACLLERPLTDAQAASIAGWRDGFTRSTTAG